MVCLCRNDYALCELQIIGTNINYDKNPCLYLLVNLRCWGVLTDFLALHKMYFICVLFYFATGISAFAIQPTSVVVTKGSVARFSCKISAHPPPIIIWEFNRVTLPLTTERFACCCFHGQTFF